MNWIDWIFVILPLLIVFYIAIIIQKRVLGVADFLSAGRVAERYVLSVSSGMAGIGLITLVGMSEMYYNSGFAVQFWSSLYLPVGFFMGLVGFCTYRFRETKAMTIGQFLEIRYSKSLRITTALIQAISGILNYAIFPAVGARFLVYFLDLPAQFNFLGLTFSSFTSIMFVFLSIALIIVMLGGQVTILVTGCVQGFFTYPMFVAILIFFFWKFSWNTEIASSLAMRPPGRSFLNPFEIENLRDFNLFYVFVGITGMFLGRLTWAGTQGYNSSAKNPHEAKMGNLLGTWRNAFTDLMFVIIGVIAFTFMNHKNFAEEAHTARQNLANKVINDIAGSKEYQTKKDSLEKAYQQIPIRSSFSNHYNSIDDYQRENTDPFLAATENTFNSDNPKEKAISQNFKTIYGQMSVSMAIKQMLPSGLLGIFCSIMIFLLISTDTTYMHSWGTIIIQDFVVPLRKKPFTPKQQIRALRIAIAGVAAFAFIFSNTFAQIDFILMFFAITGAIIAGTGAVITLGLYWSKGTTQGAFVSVVSGAIIAIAGIILQKLWKPYLYPFLDNLGCIPSLSDGMDFITSYLQPYIVWEITPDKFPINSQEILFLTNLFSLSLYILISLKTCKTPFNMDKMLHRGIYKEVVSSDLKNEKKSFWQFFKLKILGIDEHYSSGDKAIAWAAFIWSFGYVFGICFLGAVCCQQLFHCSNQWWSNFFFITIFLSALLLGIIFIIWFTIGGIRDLFRLFKALDNKNRINTLDDGRVFNHTSVAELSQKEIDKE